MPGGKFRQIYKMIFGTNKMNPIKIKTKGMQVEIISGKSGELPQLNGP